MAPSIGIERIIVGRFHIYISEAILKIADRQPDRILDDPFDVNMM